MTFEFQTSHVSKAVASALLFIGRCEGSGRNNVDVQYDDLEYASSDLGLKSRNRTQFRTHSPM